MKMRKQISRTRITIQTTAEYSIRNPNQMIKKKKNKEANLQQGTNHSTKKNNGN